MYSIYQGGEENEKAVEAQAKYEARLLYCGLGYIFVPLNGGSQTRRDVVTFYKEIYPEILFEVTYTGFSLTIKRKREENKK